MAAKIRKGDKVIVISGAQKGAISEITALVGQMATLNNINMRKRHIKKTKNANGRIEQFAAPIHVSNLAHVLENKAVKVKFQIEGHNKFLVDRKTGTRIRKV